MLLFNVFQPANQQHHSLLLGLPYGIGELGYHLLNKPLYEPMLTKIYDAKLSCKATVSYTLFIFSKILTIYTHSLPIRVKAPIFCKFMIGGANSISYDVLPE